MCLPAICFRLDDGTPKTFADARVAVFKRILNRKISYRCSREYLEQIDCNLKSEPWDSKERYVEVYFLENEDAEIGSRCLLDRLFEAGKSHAGRKSIS